MTGELVIEIDGNRGSVRWVDENPNTREAIKRSLPLEGTATRWGDELYFETPVDLGAEKTRTEIPVGGLAYWPQGNAVCVFWGPTPASQEDEPRAAGPVNLFGRLEDVSILDALESGPHVVLEKA